MVKRHDIQERSLAYSILFAVTVFGIKPRKVVTLCGGFFLEKAPTTGNVQLYNDGGLG